jgi:hypothetical protein
MKFEIKDVIPYPVDRVYSVQHEKLSELAEFLPNITRIDVKEKRVEGTRVHYVNVWHASDHDVPAALRSFVKPDMLKWTDIATWYTDQYSCDWKSILGFLPDAIQCSGHNTWVARGNQTEVTIRGEILVHADKIGVPKLLAKSVSEAVERFVVKTIEPNLRRTNEGVRRYLDRARP